MRSDPGFRIIGSLVVLSWAMCGAALAAPNRVALEDIGFLPAEAFDVGDGLPAISVGVAAMVPRAGFSAELLIAAADAALYRAKAGGKNRVEAAGSEHY